MTIGKAMRKVRRSRGLTQKRLAKISGVSIQTISNCETDKFYPHIFTLISIADVLNVSLDRLIGRKFPREEKDG